MSPMIEDVCEARPLKSVADEKAEIKSCVDCENDELDKFETDLYSGCGCGCCCC